jgi:GT2 family glycosyltransferase
MPGLPRVSIIILNWNSYEVTRDCLLSMRTLNYLNRDITLVDNGSVDGSGERLAGEFPEVRLIKNQENLGFAGGNNVAIRDALSRGADYLLLLNNDTIVQPDFLCELVRAGESDPKIGLLNPKIYYFDPPDRIWYAGGINKPGRVFPVHIGLRERDNGEYNQAKEVSFITGCALLIKAEVVRKIGLMDETFFLSFEDADWCVRARQAGFRGFYVPSSVIWHRDAFDTERNFGSKRGFFIMRNSVVFARKHAKIKDWPRFVLSVGKYLIVRTVIDLYKGDSKRVASLYRGIWSGSWARIPADNPDLKPFPETRT